MRVIVPGGTPPDVSLDTGRVPRISTLDGFRALAIVPVICFHFFSRWTPPTWGVNLYPYGGAYRDIPLFRYGYLGVEFFFVISGFVISMTLASSTNHWDFLVKRISRLWPAMLLCSTLTFLTLTFVPLAPFAARVENFVPSLLFMEPSLARKLFHHADWMDGAYWSLSVEVRFYFWAAVLYFAARTRFLQVFFGFSAVALLLASAVEFGFPRLMPIADLMFFPNYLPWFTMGIAFYHLYAKTASRAWAHATVITSFSVLALLLYLQRNRAPADASLGVQLVVYVLILAAFYAFIYRPQWLSLFAWRPISALGAASYSLYLLHENVGVTLLRYLTVALGAPPELVAVFLILGLVGIALLISQYWEAPSKRVILRLLRLPMGTNRAVVAPYNDANRSASPSASA